MFSVHEFVLLLKGKPTYFIAENDVFVRLLGSTETFAILYPVSPYPKPYTARIAQKGDIVWASLVWGQARYVVKIHRWLAHIKP